MNKRAYLADFLLPIIILTVTVLKPSLETINQSVDVVPWASTFPGINAPAIPKQQLASSGPFQPAAPPSSLQNQQQTNNPFTITTDTAPTQAPQAASKSIAQILTNPSTPLSQKINGMFTNNTTVGGQPIKITPQTKYRIPPAAQAIATLNSISFTQGQGQENVKHPQTLFSNNPALTNAYNNFMNALKDVPSFFPLFRKIHITALHQIYLHLVGIYTSLNMTHMDDLKTYMATEKKYALNKKTLIINHLINIIMAQLNQSLRALIPGLPENYAISTGMGCVQSDKVSDPDMLVLNIEKYVLTTLGLERITESQTSLAYLGIRRYMPIVGIQTSPDLETALTYLNSTPFSIKKLTKEQATLLSDTMYTILAYLNQEQNLKDLDSLIDLLKGTSTQTATNEEVKLLAQLLAEFSYEKLLTAEIAFTKRINELIGTKDTTTTNIIPSEEILCLTNILCWILSQYEDVAAKDTIKVLDVLGTLNPTYQILSPSQAVKLKALALKMLGSKTTPPVLLENISDSDRKLLAYGLWTTSNNPNSSLSSSEKTTVQSISTPLKEYALSMEGLTQDQQMALEKALVEYSTYTLKDDPYGDEQKKLFSAPLAPGKKTYLEYTIQILSSPDFKTLNKLPKEQQILLMKIFQNMNQFIETRLETNKIEGSAIQYFIANNSVYQKMLLNSITLVQYNVLVGIYEFLKKGPIISFNTFAQMRPYNNELPMDPLIALGHLFKISESPRKPLLDINQKTPYKTSYTDILLLLKKEHFQNEITTEFVKTISPADAITYRNLFPLLNKPDFSFNQIDQPTRTVLSNALTTYKKLIAQNKSVKYTRTANNNDPTQHALETVADFISYSQQFHTKRTSFLWVLKEYLTFFNLYAQTLQNVSTDPNNPSYSGLTQFADYAKNIQNELAYESSSKESIASLLQKANPPLFFYDENTFRGIRLLPKLAMQIENSAVPISVAPFPTFGIQQASSATGTAIDPLNGKTVSNSAAIGSFSYQKFFFLQAPDSITELTGTLPAWIKETATPSTNSTGTTTLYEPNNIPADGITGFYMNIPTFAKDPANKSSMLIRLFEQPIIAQPAWLNKSGTGAKTPKAGVIPADSAGVITLLRGCLGDFQSLLDLNIFDPCLTVIFNSALALSDNNLDTQTSTNLIKDQGGKCAAYMKEKEALIKHQEDPKATVNATILGSTSQQSQGGSIALSSSTLNNAEPAQNDTTQGAQQ
jgi:hypothetical protein